MERDSCSKKIVNNAFYDDLGEMWYTADDHPIALLRSENATRIPWMCEEIKNRLGTKATILDIGCGAGMLTNALAAKKFKVTGIDLSEGALKVASQHDKTHSVKYFKGDAEALSFESASFDVVCAMDILEHVLNPEKLVKEAGRVLRPGGLFFFHTFNRTLLSYLLVIKGVEWFIPNTPPNMHLFRSFITPKEMETFCARENLHIDLLRGFIPKISLKHVLALLTTKKIPKDFQFRFSSSLKTGFCGIAIKGHD